MKNQILITGAVLSSDTSLMKIYKEIISWIDTDEFELYTPLDTMQFKGNDYERYNRAMELLQSTNLMIAEMSQISTGQGMEIQEATRLQIPILIIAKEGSKISGLVKGCRAVKEIVYYKEIMDIKERVMQFIGKGKENERNQSIKSESDT